MNLDELTRLFCSAAAAVVEELSCTPRDATKDSEQS
jgi:hypothetical protein